MQLAALNTAFTIEDMDIPGYKLHQLRGLSLMSMHNPPHPGEFIWDTYLEPHGLSVRSLAESLGVAAST